MDYDDDDYPPRPSFGGQKRKARDMSSSDEEDSAASRPSFGFQGFRRAASRSESPPTMTGLGGGPSRSAWNNKSMASAPSATIQNRGRGSGEDKQGSTLGGSSFAARMMAKMGYVEGQGLGSRGEGIINPVEAQGRPQRIGLGAVKEKSKQAREEEKRQAAARGEVIEDSSDEERQRRQRRKAQRKLDGRSGTVTPAGPPKPRFRTARELESEVEGLVVPNVLKSLVDATGKEQRVLTSTAGLMTPMEFVNQADGEALKIARRARHDLEAFVDEWKGLTERKKFIELEESQVVEEMDDRQVKSEQLTRLISALEKVQIMEKKDTIMHRFEETTSKLELIELEYRDIIDEYRLSDAAVAAIHPLFREAMEEWNPLQDPTFLVADISRLYPLLSRKRQEEENETRQRQSTSSYESLIYSMWLPRVRTALLNEWDVFDPSPATSLVVAWKDFIPSFVYSNILNQVIVPKLSTAIKEWKPRSSRRHPETPEHSYRFPWWLFTWLQYLDERHTNPKHATGLLSDVRRKFRVILDTWDLRKGLLSGIDLWKEALGSEFDVALQRHLLPRLARHLGDNFQVNPQDQDLAAFEDVLKWKDLYKPKVFGLLLVAEFFPKWHDILYIWLTNEPNFEEVGEWFTWWRSQIPAELNEIVVVDEEWTKGLKMMDLASQLGDRAATELPPPKATSRAIAITAAGLEPEKATPIKTPKSKPPIKEIAFKDIVEEWCADQGLIILPLREAHPQNGHPLFRITASASGKGGVIAFLQGDVVWVQNRKTKEIWEPMGLEEQLVERAEGK